MLVLSAGVRDAANDVLLVIDGEVIAEVAVVEARGNKVRLAIEAQRSVEIVRRKVYERSVGNANVSKSE